MTHSTQKDWRELCFAVTNESDSPKLILLVQELIETLDKGERRWRHTSCPPTKSRRIRTRLSASLLSGFDHMSVEIRRSSLMAGGQVTMSSMPMFR